MEEKQKPPGFRVKQVASFECAIHQNATNIAIALAQAGRMVTIRGYAQGGNYAVEVYERV